MTLLTETQTLRIVVVLMAIGWLVSSAFHAQDLHDAWKKGFRTAQSVYAGEER